MKNLSVPTTTVRCAVYTRKSTEEGLEQAFNSLDAQREAGQAYIASQKHEGWNCLETPYDDGGFSGGNTDRPALQRLLRDLEAGRIDVVVVYKIDRLSRSLMDFTRLMERFEKHRVSLVSVTQQINTSTSMGRLMLNVLMSFGQFEREIIAERTRDKLAAMARKGIRVGGVPPLGYELDQDRRLQIIADEAHQVMQIFRLYREHGSLLPVVQELHRLEWRNKAWTTHDGQHRGGKVWTRTSLHRLLTNPLYAGQVRHRDQVFPGQHPAIIEPKVFEEVQLRLRRNGQRGQRVSSGALLRGLLFCRSCGTAMTPSSTQKGNRKYRYYTCTTAAKQGHANCPTGSVAAGAIEEFVIERIRGIGADPQLLEETVSQALSQQTQQREFLQSELRMLERERKRSDLDLRKCPAESPLRAALSERLLQSDTRLEERSRELAALRELPAERLREQMRQFRPVWDALTQREQTSLIRELVARIEYDAHAGEIDLQLQPSGLEAWIEGS